VFCRSVCRSVSVTIVSPAKKAELIEIPFGMWSRVGPRKYVLEEMHIVATWRIRVSRGVAFFSNYFDHLFLLMITTVTFHQLQFLISILG